MAGGLPRHRGKWDAFITIIQSARFGSQIGVSPKKGKSHDLLESTVVALVATNTSAKLVFGHKVHELGENHPSLVHTPLHSVCEHNDGNIERQVQVDNGKISSQLIAA